MERPATTPASTEAYDAIAGNLVPLGVVSGKMMGMPTLYVDGRAFAGLYGSAMVFKLAGPEHEHALSLAGSGLFDPSGRGRPMKAWVQVPAEHAALWPQLADRALASAREAR